VNTPIHNRYGGTGGEVSVSGSRLRARRLNHPSPLWGSNGVAFGPDGRLYVAQFLAGQISAVDPATGDVEVVVPMDGPVQSPDDLAFGADGSMYIADLIPGRVWRRSPQGAYTLVSDEVKVVNGITCVGDRLFVNEMRPGGRVLELFPHGGEAVVLTEGLALGNAMQLGPDGLLYYPHMLTNQVWRIPPDGGEPEMVAEDVHQPVAVRFDQGGVLHVLSRGTEGIVTRIDLHGTGARTLVTSGLVGLDNAAFDAENRMFVSSYASGGITELHPDGRTREIVPRGLDGPYGVTVDLGGTVYVADHYRLASPAPDDEGEPVTADAASAAGGVTSRTLMPFAHGVTNAGGRVHFTSQYGDVHTYDPDRRTTRQRVTGLNEPVGITVAPDGSLVVAEAGAGRVVSIGDGEGEGEGDTVTVLAEGLGHPVDVAFDAQGRCHVSDARLGAVLRIAADGTTAVVADGLGAPHGLAVLGDTLFTVETGPRRLTAISLSTGERRTEAADLPVGQPPGIARRTEPALFTHGMVGAPRPFAGLATGPDGSLFLSANGEGTVWRLTGGGPAPGVA
jgi:sugar lactone lactonase YvrE